jgi:hypothetical protein
MREAIHALCLASDPEPERTEQRRLLRQQEIPLIRKLSPETGMRAHPIASMIRVAGNEPKRKQPARRRHWGERGVFLSMRRGRCEEDRDQSCARETHHLYTANASHRRSYVYYTQRRKPDHRGKRGSKDSLESNDAQPIPAAGIRRY